MLVLGGLGALFGVALALAAKKFAVEQDPRFEKIVEVLPGANCGGCGYPGCSGLAEAISKGSAPVDACPVGGAAVAAKVATIMGQEPVKGYVRKVARVMCGGDRANASTRFLYSGLNDCKAAGLVAGGPKACTYGCLGLGSCVRACPFDAMRMGDNGLPIVDEEKCTGCGKCVAACPRNLIVLVPDSSKVNVYCKSEARGAQVRKVCKVGCIGCGLCVKVCPNSAIVLENNLASILPEKCDACGRCVEKCPTKCIIMKGEGASSGCQGQAAPRACAG
ncbi:MAG TPA: RnfABCDGE type electron transport complex subunit B [Firmicutes bacterium]|nr:RnfABCDGE type electron transport complex subunit B [Bacillota bacterium]